MHFTFIAQDTQVQKYYQRMYLKHIIHDALICML